MTNFNTAIRFDPDAVSNPNLVDLTRKFNRKDNGSFLVEVASRLAEISADQQAQGQEYRFDSGGVGCIGLIGEYGLIGYTVRRAQELIRTDRRPSYWSHAFLLYSPLARDLSTNRNPKRSAWIWESSLEPSTGFGTMTDFKGISARRIGEYAHASFDYFQDHSVPNMAILAIGLKDSEREAILARADDPDVDQLRYDLADLLGSWYAYITNPADHHNPITKGSAIFGSAYVQLAYDAAGIDLGPGAHQRNITPEHIWQAAKRLSPMLSTVDQDGNAIQRPVAGWYCVREKACVAIPPDKAMPSSLRGMIQMAERRRSRE